MKPNSKKLEAAIADIAECRDAATDERWQAKFDNVLDVLYVINGRKRNAPQGKVSRLRRLVFIRSHRELWEACPPPPSGYSADWHAWRLKYQPAIFQAMVEAGLYSPSTNCMDVNIPALILEVQK